MKSKELQKLAGNYETPKEKAAKKVKQAKEDARIVSAIFLLSGYFLYCLTRETTDNLFIYYRYAGIPFIGYDK